MSEGKEQEDKQDAPREEASQENEEHEQQSSAGEERQESEEELIRTIIGKISGNLPEVLLNQFVTEVVRQLSPEGQRTVVAEVIRVFMRERMSQREPVEDVTDALAQAMGDALAQAMGQAADSTSAQAEASTTRRLSVVFSEAAYKAVQNLAKSRDKPVSEYVREALALQKWFDNKRADGWRILTERRGRVREVLKLK